MISYALQPLGAGPLGTGFPPNPFGTCGAAIANGRVPARIAIVVFILRIWVRKEWTRDTEMELNAWASVSRNLQYLCIEILAHIVSPVT
jgi:hypothetical protein